MKSRSETCLPSRDIRTVLMRVSTREVTPPHASAAAFFLAGTVRENVNAGCTVRVGYRSNGTMFSPWRSANLAAALRGAGGTVSGITVLLKSGFFQNATSAADM